MLDKDFRGDVLLQNIWEHPFVSNIRHRRHRDTHCLGNQCRTRDIPSLQAFGFQLESYH